ncbi:hypothetical protein GQ43DRAFT_474104 [Delitschia confertaspora ATCC 74209]|uniref:Uncharacterized protein n=1 Tax=Delitschia confertaspora ATCC 74209 TaxID=1513339 RepID=A0A9P4MQG1_9PLEO|nr:hypothetical protein GQ43DRAFT_474104 [Delitschia confertaspora ATCC 74209]
MKHLANIFLLTPSDAAGQHVLSNPESLPVPPAPFGSPLRSPYKPPMEPHETTEISSVAQHAMASKSAAPRN